MKLTIQKFQAINEVSISPIEDIDKSIQYLSILMNRPVEEIQKMSVDDINKMSADIVGYMNHTYTQKMKKDKPQRYIKTNGQWYEIHYDLTKEPYNAGRYVEVVTFSKDIIKNLHKILASMVTPVKFDWFTFKFKPVKEISRYPHSRIALDMLNADVSIAYHSAVFFWTIFNKFIQNSQIYLKGMKKNQMEAKKILLNLQKISDGYIQPQWLQKWKNANLMMSGEYK